MKQEAIEARLLRALKKSGPLSMAQLLQRTVPIGSPVPPEWEAAVRRLVSSAKAELVHWTGAGVIVPGLQIPDEQRLNHPEKYAATADFSYH